MKLPVIFLLLLILSTINCTQLESVQKFVANFKNLASQGNFTALQNLIYPEIHYSIASRGIKEAFRANFLRRLRSREITVFKGASENDALEIKNYHSAIYVVQILAGSGKSIKYALLKNADVDDGLQLLEYNETD
ncbi:unnamed protein product [Caenorhabditis angaria]|uniref:DUF38 domain-containing protein n=1 Tax=Caenorhabditis angaria TaxID=860376 RepID=A0A9P1IEP8_9PELO|nr:unnamed protein product [Caenorhabditis angaria]